MGLIQNKEGSGKLPMGAMADRTRELIPQVRELSVEQGMSIIAISRKLKMSQDTVRRCLKEDSKEGVKNALHTINRYLPRIAEMVCKKVLAKEDVPHGLEVLEKAGVFPHIDQPQQNFSDPRLMIAIQNLLPQQSQHASVKLMGGELPIAETIDAPSET